MNRRWFSTGLQILLAAASCVLWVGCGMATVEQHEARAYHLRRALAAKEAGDIDRAIGWCEKALQRHPKLALAHRELALMLDHYREDYIGALYHYQRYLHLRPESPDRSEVEEMIRHCLVAFAAQIGATSAETKQVLQTKGERLRELELENATLRTQIAAGGEGPAIPAVAMAAAPKGKPRQTVHKAAAPPPAQTHQVQAGDTLATISQKYYGTMAKWQFIFDANRDRLPNANTLRTGMDLVIPTE